MNSLDTANTIAVPLGHVGLGYYGAPSTVARAAELGLDWVGFYGLGRGGVLGNVDSAAVHEAFVFFHRNAVDFLWNAHKDKADPVTTAAAHIEAAYAYADSVFADMDADLLQNFADAVQKVVGAVPSGQYSLFDGYHQYAVPTLPVHAAYLGAILMRELRGGIHIQSVASVDLSPAAACYLEDANLFAMHGYGPDDIPVDVATAEVKKAAAEELTTKAMTAYLEVLTDLERSALAGGATAMFAATKPAN